MQRIYIYCNKKTTPVPQPSDPTTSRQRRDTAIHISSAYPFVEHLRLSIVPAYSNLHVLVMLAYLGILLSAFDSCVSRPCCIPSIVQTSTKTVLHVCTSWTHQHPCIILIHARPTCTIYETQKGPFAHRTVRWALPDGDSHLPGGPSYELTTRSRVRAISRGPGAGRGDCPRCFCSAPISVGEWQRCAKLRLLCTTK